MKKLLIVIDMQNDYLHNSRKPQFNYDTEYLVMAVNDLIDKYQKEHYDVVYVRHLIQNLWTNRKLFGFSIEGTFGADIFDRVHVVSNLVFDKYVGDSFSNKKLRKLAESSQYDQITLCGVDMCGCVGATAKGAVKRGYNVSIVDGATGCKFDKSRRNSKIAELKKVGVAFE